MKTSRRTFRLGLWVLSAVLLTGWLWPERFVIPVQAATKNDWNQNSFWYEPWGVSGVHKGIDIFAAKGTPVIAASAGMVVFAGNLPRGGNVILVLGAKWRLHYYAHLESVSVSLGRLVSMSEMIGTVGDTGNAAGKPPHLHFTILSLIPNPWRWSADTQGWKKMFFLDPDAVLRNGQ